jgi:hypothetical protein
VSQVVPSPPARDFVAGLWFFRLVRGVREQDYLVASEARLQLSRLGWRVTHQQACKSHPSAPDKEADRA